MSIEIGVFVSIRSAFLFACPSFKKMASDDISEMIHDFEYNRCMDVLDKKFAPKRPAPKAKVAKVTKQRGRKKVMDPDQVRSQATGVLPKAFVSMPARLVRVDFY